MPNRTVTLAALASIIKPLNDTRVSRTHADFSDRRLISRSGAEKVISVLKHKGALKHLLLGNNELGDDGIGLIMEYLCSEDGRRLSLEEIGLNVTHIGDQALDAISRYLNGNQTLVGLHLQNVCFPIYSICFN